jgi:hypothetical protein
MLKNLKQSLFPFVIAFSALSVSASAAFYSVSGLSKLFAGASFEVIIMAGSLEISKLVIASLLYQYWDTLNKFLRTYLSIATVILVLITSMGIYGFLSAAYQETYRELTIKNNKVEFLENKAKFYEDDVNRYDEELKRIASNISILSNAKSQSIQVRDTTVSGGVRTTISTSELRLAQRRIEVEEQNRKDIQAKRQVAADSLQTFKLDILDLENDTDVAGELGPLEYLSGLTGTSMDKIINILLLVIIFVFDPLAISLVIAANFAFAQAFPKKKYRENLYGEEVEVKDDTSVWDEDHALDQVLNDMVEDLDEEDLNDIEVKDAEEVKSKEEFFEQLDKIENKKKNSWEIIDDEPHDDEEEDVEWDELDLNKDGIIDLEEINVAKARIKELQNTLATKSLSGWRRNKISSEIDRIKGLIPKEDDDLTIIY